MSFNFSMRLLWLLILLILIGTLMSNTWRLNVVVFLNLPILLSSWMHFLLFAAMAILTTIRPLAWRLWSTLLMACALALVTEGLQFFTIDRHPRWLDVGIDMSGALAAILLALLVAKITKVWRVFN